MSKSLDRRNLRAVLHTPDDVSIKNWTAGRKIHLVALLGMVESSNNTLNNCRERTRIVMKSLDLGNLRHIPSVGDQPCSKNRTTCRKIHPVARLDVVDPPDSTVNDLQTTTRIVSKSLDLGSLGHVLNVMEQPFSKNRATG